MIFFFSEIMITVVYICQNCNNKGGTLLMACSVVITHDAICSTCKFSLSDFELYIISVVVNGEETGCLHGEA